MERAGKKLKRVRKGLSRKARSGENRAEARAKVARQHAKVVDRRRDWHHKLSTRIIRDNQAVFVKTLNPKGLGRARLATPVHEPLDGRGSSACWSTRP